MRPVFADPRTDFVFQRLFGEDEHKHLTIALLDALLGLEGDRCIAELSFLRDEGRPRVPELKRSAVDARCRDRRGTTFVVELQVLAVEGFEKRVVYNACRTYVGQLGKGDPYPTLDHVIAVSLCDFVLWPSVPGEPDVPLVSRWRMQEAQGARVALGQVRYVFVELPKLAMDRLPTTAAEEWAWVFRHAETLDAIPEALKDPQPRAALEAARTRWFDEEEWDEYDRARVAEQDARETLALALTQGHAEGFSIGRAQGRTEGRAEGVAQGRTEGIVEEKRRALARVLTRRGLPLTQEAHARIEACGDAKTLDRWFEAALAAEAVEDALR
jgi:predicted transposase/invertase (TIGR01784 family)